MGPICKRAGSTDGAAGWKWGWSSVAVSWKFAAVPFRSSAVPDQHARALDTCSPAPAPLIKYLT